MDFGLFQTNHFGLIVYSIYILTIVWIVLKKEYKGISVLFPLVSLIEGLFIDWRWNQLQNFDGLNQLILGGLPSLLIAVGFPFIGFYLHHFLPAKVRFYMNSQNLFPFSSKALEKNDLPRYFKRGFIYSCSTLILHELSQTWNLSSRNTFDTVDLIFIVIGSIISILVYQLIKNL